MPGRREEVLRFKPDEIKPGTCRIMQLGDRKVAVCRDESGDAIRIYVVVED